MLVGRMCLSAIVMLALGAMSLSAVPALADPPDTQPVNTDQQSVKENGQPDAKRLALAVYQKASAIDALPRFLLSADAGTRSFKPLKDPSPDELVNLKRALDEPTEETDWYRYETTFGWDEQGFIDAFHSSDFDTMRWGTRELGGQFSRRGDQAPLHVLRAGASEIWKDSVISNPNYLLATRHKFWWGDNSYRHQCFSSVPPELAEYRLREPETFDGELCHVVESPTRQERLWISQKTGLLRGYLQLSHHVMVPGFHKSVAVQKIAGREFATNGEYSRWLESAAPDLKVQVSIVWSKTMDFNTARPSLIVRFRDYREIAPGVWWPFSEDRAQGGGSPKEGFECMISTYRVQEARTDRDLRDRIAAVRPKEGEQVQDQRYAVPVNYQYRTDRTEEQIRDLANDAQRKLLDDKKILDRVKETYQQLVGKRAPQLPADGWLGGQRPMTEGQPYLVHFWAVWCGPCKNDMPLLKQLAESGVTIVGLHPEGTEPADVEKTIKEHGLTYPTFLSPKSDSPPENRMIAGYPDKIFPYYVLVDAQGKVACHGSLTDKDADLLPRYWELRSASKSK